MKLIIVVFTIINCYTAIFNTMKINQEVIAVYGYSNHVNDDGSPSRDDRRYHKKNLYLYNDLSFKIIEQNGRLVPKYEFKTGTWEIEDNKLIVNIKERQLVCLIIVSFCFIHKHH